MQCYICKQKLGEYECSVCNNLVCKDHYRSVNNKIYCVKHIPTNPTLNTLKNAIVSVFVILLGMLLIAFIANYYAAQTAAIAPLLSFMNAFAAVQTMLISGVALILFILILAYLLLRRKYISKQKQ